MNVAATKRSINFVLAADAHSLHISDPLLFVLKNHDRRLRLFLTELDHNRLLRFGRSDRSGARRLRQKWLLDGLGNVAGQVMGSSQVASHKTDVPINGAFQNDVAVACAELAANS